MHSVDLQFRRFHTFSIYPMGVSVKRRTVSCQAVRFVLAFLFLLFPLGAQTLLIRDVTVIDTSGGASRVASVLLKGGRIVSVGKALKATRTIDGRGKYLIPALWDMHVHLWEAEPFFPLYIANGVLGLRDMGSTLSQTRAWAKQANAPRIFSSGVPIDGPTPVSGLKSFRVASTAEATSAVDQIDDSGADFVKILSGLSRDAYRAVAQRARILRIPFAGHLPDSVPLSEAIDSRQRSVEHLFGVLLSCSSEEAELRQARLVAKAGKDSGELRRINQRIAQTFGEEKALALFRKSRIYGTWHTPTLTFRQRMSLIGVKELVTDPRLKYIPAGVKKTWNDPTKALEKASSEQMELRARDFNWALRLTKTMRRAGLDLLAGTGTGDPYVLPGFALHDELGLLVLAGLTPLEALQAATRNPAIFFNLEKTHGSIEPGKAADLVLLNGDPLANIANTRRIEAVIQGGRLHTRKDLDRMLSAQERAAK